MSQGQISQWVSYVASSRDTDQKVPHNNGLLFMIPTFFGLLAVL